MASVAISQFCPVAKASIENTSMNDYGRNDLQ
jgi:hypothetical protein